MSRYSKTERELKRKAYDFEAQFYEIDPKDVDKEKLYYDWFDNFNAALMRVKKGLSSGYVAARDVKGNYLGGWWIHLPTERGNTYKDRPYQKDFELYV